MLSLSKHEGHRPLTGTFHEHIFGAGRGRRLGGAEMLLSNLGPFQGLGSDEHDKSQQNLTKRNSA